MLENQSVTLPMHVFDAIHFGSESWREALTGGKGHRFTDKTGPHLFGAHNIGDRNLTNLQEPFVLASGARVQIQNWYATSSLDISHSRFRQWAQWTTLSLRVRGLVQATRSVFDLLQRRSAEASPLSAEGDAQNAMVEHRHVLELAERFYYTHARALNESTPVRWEAHPGSTMEPFIQIAKQAKQDLCVAPSISVGAQDHVSVDIATSIPATQRLLSVVDHAVAGDLLADDVAVWLHLEGLAIFRSSP